MPSQHTRNLLRFAIIGFRMEMLPFVYDKRPMAEMVTIDPDTGTSTSKQSGDQLTTAAIPHYIIAGWVPCKRTRKKWQSLGGKIFRSNSRLL